MGIGEIPPSIPKTSNKVFTPINKKDIIDKGYIMTLSEFASINYQQVIAQNTNTGTSTTLIYQVPANYTLYIINSWISAADSTLAPAGAYIAVSTPYISLGEVRITGGENSVSNCYNMPVKVESGGQINLVIANCRAVACITGWIVPKSIY